MTTTTLAAGQVFEDGKAATRAVQDYALAINKHVVVSRGGGGHKRFRCSSDACGFFVQLYQFRSSGKRLKSWYISSLQLEHVNCTSVGKVTGRQLGQLPSFRDAVRSDPNISARALAELVQKSDGIVPPDNSAIYRERERVLQDSKTEENERIPSRFEHFTKTNPGSYTAWEADDTGGFRRAIVVSASLVRSMPFNQPVLGLDCMPLKNDHYDGYQMGLVGRDGNCDNVLIAVALVNEEDVENYTWFVQCLLETGLALADYPVFCHRSGGFAAVANVFNISVRYCTLHIIKTLLRTFPTFTEAHHQLIWDLQGATFQARYQGCLSLIGVRCGEEVENYLRAISPEQWALYPALGARPLYGWSTTNFVAVGGTSLLDELCEKGPYEFIDGVLKLMAKSTHERAERATKWASQNRLITPGAQALYDDQHLKMAKYVVTRSSPVTGSVARVGQIPPFPYHVDLSLNRCTCAFMDQLGVPCRHMIAMLANARAMESVFSRFAACYKVATYANAFGSAQPLELSAGNEIPPAQILPVKRKLPQGKRLKNQNASEGGERPTRVQRCGQCKEIGHNRRGCSRHSRPRMQPSSGSTRPEMTFPDGDCNTAQPQVQASRVSDD